MLELCWKQLGLDEKVVSMTRSGDDLAHHGGPRAGYMRAPRNNSSKLLGRNRTEPRNRACETTQPGAALGGLCTRQLTEPATEAAGTDG